MLLKGVEVFGTDFYQWLDDTSAKVPDIYIDIEDNAVPEDKDTYLEASISVIGNSVIADVDSVPVKIKGRGNSSWRKKPEAKNPYRLKFNKKINLIGARKGKNWVLLSNNRKGSMLANAIAFYIADLIQMPFANHFVPVELYLNHEYWGSYMLTEKVGVANNSIDLIDESKAFLLELDSYSDTSPRFISSSYHLPVNVKFPKVDVDSVDKINAIKEHFNAFLIKILHSEKAGEYIDMESLVKFLLINELALNIEIWKPRSVFLYNENVEDESSKYHFGPVWDFDWAFGVNSENLKFFQKNVEKNFWNIVDHHASGFWNDLYFNLGATFQVYHEEWKDFVENHLPKVLDFCDKYYAFVKKSFEHNAEVRNETTDYQNQVKQAKLWINTRSHSILHRLELGNTSWNQLFSKDTVCVFNIHGVIISEKIQVKKLRYLLPKSYYIVNGKKLFIR